MLVMFNFFLHWKQINLRFVLTLKLNVSHSQLSSCILVFVVWKKLFYKSTFGWGWFGIYISLVKTVVKIKVEQKIV
jgi:hypothetical protein